MPRLSRAPLRAGLLADGPARRSATDTSRRAGSSRSMPPFAEVTRRAQRAALAPGARGPRDAAADGHPSSTAFPSPRRYGRSRTSLRVAPEQLARLCGEALVRRLVTQEELEAAGLTARPPAAAAAFARRFSTLRRAGLPPRCRAPDRPLHAATSPGPPSGSSSRPTASSAHGQRSAFERPRPRRLSAARGWVVLRVTWRRLQREPVRVMAELAQILAPRGNVGTARAPSGTASTSHHRRQTNVGRPRGARRDRR